MKTWHLVVLAGVGFVIVIAVLNASQTQRQLAYVQNQQGSNLNPLLNLGASIFNFAGQAFKPQPPSSAYYPNQGTYNTGGGVVSGNTLTDPNTGKELTYGTD